MYGTGTSLFSPNFNRGPIKGQRKPNPSNGITLRDGQGIDKSTLRDPGVNMNRRGGSVYSPANDTPPPVGVTAKRGSATEYFPINLGGDSPVPTTAPAGPASGPGIGASELRAVMNPNGDDIVGFSSYAGVRPRSLSVELVSPKPLEKHHAVRDVSVPEAPKAGCCTIC